MLRIDLLEDPPKFWSKVATHTHTQLETTFLEAVAIVNYYYYYCYYYHCDAWPGLCEREGSSFRALPGLICCLMLSGQV